MHVHACIHTYTHTRTHTYIHAVTESVVLHMTMWPNPPLWFSSSKADLAENAKQGLNKLLANEVPIEIKPVNPPHFYRVTASEPRKLFWVRARGHIGNMGRADLHTAPRHIN